MFRSCFRWRAAVSLLDLEIPVSSITRALTGENLTFDLAGQIADLRQDESYVRSGRVGRTLVKAGPLRLTHDHR